MTNLCALTPAKLRSGLTIIAVLFVAVTAGHRAAYGFSFGITSNAFGSAGCNQCHGGGTTPQVQLSGPTEVVPNQTSEYTLEIMIGGGQNGAGFNVADSSGALATGGANSSTTQTLTNFTTRRVEVTHRGAKAATEGTVRFSFFWTAPAVPGTVSLNAWGNAVNRNGTTTGDQAARSSLAITVRDAAPTATPTATPSPSPTPVTGGCPGDCDDSGDVTVDEILIGVNIASGSVPVDACPAFDVGDDDAVTIDEILLAVNAALLGCPP